MDETGLNFIHICAVLMEFLLLLPLIAQAAREAGFGAALGKLMPLEASPMNDVLLGWPACVDSVHSERHWGRTLGGMGIADQTVTSTD